MNPHDSTISYNISEDNSEILSKSELREHYKPNKLILVKDDSILAKIRAGKHRKQRSKTQGGYRNKKRQGSNVSISNEFISENNTNTTLRKDYSNYHVEIHITTDPNLVKKSLTWKMVKFSKAKNEKLEGLKSAYRKPIRLVKLKVDNTQEFHLHPSALTKFILEAIKDPLWKDKLIKYHITYSK
mmetsp:Transcript_4571/g.3844  ORF Transcript_4571/g.3844 Transcript_4571/m.3844 type:complete len:185 (+) Transcript_4571:160-714(+)